jgi:hypothetical protein
VSAAALADKGLTELQDRIAGRLRIDPIDMATLPGITRRRVGVAVTFGLVTLLNISALLYALIH